MKIKWKDGQTFVVRPEQKKGSPLAVGGPDIGLTTDEIVAFIREGRKEF